MYIRKRGQFYHYEFFVNGRRYAGSFNGKNGAKTAANKKEATEFAYQERRKVLDGSFRDEMERWDPLESTCRHASLSIL